MVQGLKGFRVLPFDGEGVSNRRSLFEGRVEIGFPRRGLLKKETGLVQHALS